jgi:hypothetical protein
MARARQIALFEREVHERLSPSAIDLVLRRAQVLSEGQRATRAGHDVYCGSTMLTIDLADMAAVLRDACDAGCAARLATQLRTDKAAIARVQTVAANETERLAANRPKSLTAEIRVRNQGSRVFVDVDVEATF